MLCDMWNYAPLASGLHRLPSEFSLAASLHLSSLEKSHEVSISKADCPHVFLYRYSLQASISHAHPKAVGTWRFFLFGSLAPGQYPPLFNFNLEISL